MPDLAVELLDALGDAELDGELAQLVEVLEQDGVGYQDLAVGEADGVAVEVDQAEAALGVRAAQEAGDRAVRTGDHQVAQDGLPGLVRPHGGEHRGGHRQRAHHPALDVVLAAPLVRGQPLGELPELGDHRVVTELRRYGLERAARRVPADHLALSVECDAVPSRARLHPCHGRTPPTWEHLSNGLLTSDARNVARPTDNATGGVEAGRGAGS